MDLSVNHLRGKFQEWYANQVTSKNITIDFQQNRRTKLLVIHYHLCVNLELKWLMSMYEHIQDNPQIVTNGFLKAEIPQALSRHGGEASPEADSEDDSSDKLFDYSHDSSSESSISAYNTV